MLTKKIFSLAVLAFLVVSPVFAQQKKEDEASTSKTIEFMDKDGSLIVKEFYDLATIKGVKCQVLIVKDVVVGKKIGCMRLETTHYTSYTSSPDTYIGTLDSDELDACIKSLSYLKENLLSQSSETYTEASYKSRDKVEIGAYYSADKKKWTAYVQTKSYTNRSMQFFDADNLDALAQEMEKAKAMIAEKVK